MREYTATFWKKDKQYTLHATGYPVLLAGLRHLLDRRIDFLADIRMAEEIYYVVDVGANLGFTAMMFHLAFPKAEVLAIEPSSHNSQFLRKNISQVDRITHLQVAAAAEDGELWIALPTKEQRGDIQLKLEDYDNTGAISVYGTGTLYREKVTGRKLDDMVTQKVDYMKLDIEGYEIEALKGAHRILTEDRPYIQIEMRPTTQLMAGLDIHDVHRHIQGYEYVRVGKFQGDSVYSPSELVNDSITNIKLEKTFSAPNPNLMGRFKYHLRSYDIRFLNVINKVKKIGIVYDVGACIGVMSILFQIVFPEVKVYSCEPSATNYEHLLNNVGHLQGVHPMKIALSNKDGSTNIAMPTREQRPELTDESEHDSAIVSVYGESEEHSEKVDCYRLDSLVTEPVDMIKIDAEGHEWEVLEGSANILRVDRPIVLLNIRKGTQRMAGRTQGDLHNKIKEYGYKKVGHYKGDGIYFPNELELPLDEIPEEMKG